MSRAPLLWVDVGDLFGHAGAFRRPSGVQRVVFEVCQALAAMDPCGRRAGFVRHGRAGFVPVAWASIAAMFAALAEEGPPAPAKAVSPMRVQIDALQALLAIPASFRAPADGMAASDAVRPGDVLLIAGAGWSEARHVARVAAARKRQGLRVALLVYDIIPLLRPEWFDPLEQLRFGRWLEAMLVISDHLLAISAATAGDLATWRASRGMLERAVHVVRLGDGFSQSAATVPVAHGVEGPYALFVSTLEFRKNHAVAVEVWRRLLALFGPDQVPRLVFAGRPGGLTGDLMHMLVASDFLGGHVILRPNASDSEIEALYRGCAFTVFPSHYEGWGLPVAESFAFGKPCFAASTSSLPEVGGDLARYFDPLDPDAAVRMIAAVLRDPADLAVWQARVADEFRPTAWCVTAQMVLDGVA